jgi:hypothetical protein
MDIKATLGKRVSARQGDFATAQSNQATIRKPWKSLAAMAFGLLLSVPGFTQAQYNFTTIDVTIGGQHATATEPNGNSTNAIVGQFNFEDGLQHGFVLNNGVFTEVDVPDSKGNAQQTAINGIDAAGRLAGTYLDSSDPPHFHAFFGNKGGFTTLDPPGSFATTGGFINAQSQVVGFYRADPLEPQRRRGFIWRNGTFTTFNEPDDASNFGTRAFGINDIGEVVGDYQTADGKRHGYLRSKKDDFTTLDVTGAVLTTAEGINNAGTIVGFYNTVVDPQTMETFTHGFVLKKGIFTTVEVRDSNGNAQPTQIFSINAKGEIVGSYDDSKGVQHGFVGSQSAERTRERGTNAGTLESSFYTHVSERRRRTAGVLSSTYRVAR